ASPSRGFQKESSSQLSNGSAVRVEVGAKVRETSSVFPFLVIWSGLWRIISKKAFHQLVEHLDDNFNR
ncbi:MAG: hypothetical protein AAFY88_23635, partial [Acidobacteriota bacterium]